MSKNTKKEQKKLEEENTREVSKDKDSKEFVQQEDKSEKLKKLEEENASLKKHNLLLEANSENIRKNFQQQLRYNNKNLIAFFIDFFIDLEEKAIKTMRASQKDKVKNHLQGIEMMADILWKKLKSKGVKEIEIKIGETSWSSRLHELAEEVENNDLPKGTVIEVLEKGYLLEDQVLRPARVKVSKKGKKP
ncbi:nucleotide exchange factor GrpE [endosymbiont GvMRE of Glomus versiforme]|uniref:nucleotide exchange factor GrpE n=1 Tax=endosymbiont GvMRE of Glomus versiforme TaxID=2039283 RepID=UPI000EC8D2D3|nr:nucleotide exchange factor GrpE [endosymbiont GvMRE of Glomus versiforme]RHZ35371.1 Protein GrpE [endosymbiont GvMRE of Glomus versiforme]